MATGPQAPPLTAAPWWRRIDGPIWALLAAIAFGTAVRLVMLTTGIARFESDEAVTGVMAQRILHGDFPAYFGIQSYQGALEQYLQAPVLALLPDTPLALRSVQVVLSALICVLVYVLGTRMVGSRWGGALAAVLFAVAPYYSAIKSIRSHGGYDGAVIFGLLVVLLALVLRREGPRSHWVAAALGLCAGLAIWENYLSAYLLIPAVLWAFGSARGGLTRLLPWGIGGLIVGLAPVIAFRLANGINPPSGTGTPPVTSFAGRMDLLLSPVTGQFLGVRSGVEVFDRYLPAALVTIVAFGVLGAAVWVRRWGLWDLVTLRSTRREPIDIVVLAFVVAPFLYAASSYTWYSGEPRYLYTLYPFLTIGVAAAVFALHGRARIVMAAIVIMVGAVLLLGTMKAVYDRGGEISVADGGLVYTEDLPQVADALEARGITSAWADYWVANPLQFFGGDALNVASTSINHFPGSLAAAKRDPKAAVVSVTGPGADGVRAALQKAGRRFQQATAGRFTIFWGITPPWRPGA